MDANKIVHDLQDWGIIGDGDLKTIEKTSDKKQQNQTLHYRLLHTCDDEALMTVCKIMIDAGVPKMRGLGNEMKNMLEGKCYCVVVLCICTCCMCL